ncbi:MAG: hypothetical protein LBQ94_02075 [Treponema sp.]|jgi:hypothetical protein|nr:hypothetical protein [Treponema sp.]
MPSNKSWRTFIVSTPDPDFHIVEINYNGKDVAAIKKDTSDNNRLIIEWLETEKKYTIPLDWLLDVLQFAKNKLS